MIEPIRVLAPNASTRSHGAETSRGCTPEKRTAIPATRARRDRLRHLHARHERAGDELEFGGREDQGLSFPRNHWPSFFEILHGGGPSTRRTAKGARHR